jgi:4-hydroxy-tetrahydrodipicolinate synthase
MVTPMDSEGKVDYAQARKLARALIKSGSDGLVVSGTTGESPTLTHEEKLKLFVEVRAAVGKQVPIIAGTGSNDTAESVRFTREAEKTGVDGALLVVPYYNRPTQDGLYQHFKAIAEATKLPCVLYNVPGRTVTSLAPETVIRLSQVPGIAGVKEASGNLEQIARIIDGVRKDFFVWSGNDSDTLPIMALGGYGVISVSAHLVGVQTKKMIDLVLTGRITEAAVIHRKLLPLVNALFVIPNPMPVKYALNVIGFRAGKPRLPLTEPDEKSAAVIKNAVNNCRIDLPV